METPPSRARSRRGPDLPSRRDFEKNLIMRRILIPSAFALPPQFPLRA
jgi:hypothetical protein